MPKTTKKHFNLFVAECEKWIEIFGLKGWEFHYHHTKLDGFNNAASNYHLGDRYADIYFFPKLKRIKPVAKQIKLLAFHEICEVFIGPLFVNANARYVARHEILESTHAIIVTLQNILYRKY